MRRLWLALLLAVSASSPLAGQEAVSLAREARREVAHADHLPSLDLAQTAFGFELVEKQDGRSRDESGRGPNGRSLVSADGTVAWVSRRGELLSPDVPPAPAQAERLPYHATAPPPPAG